MISCVHFNKVSFLSCCWVVIDAWSRRSGNDVAERAERVLRRLVNNYERTNNKFLRPDVISYSAAMKACVSHPNGGEKALKILEEMNNQYRDGNIKARPDTQALAVAIDACAKSGLTTEAERILNDVDDSKKHNVLFNTIMSGYKSEGRGKEAEAVLRRMIRLEDAGNNRCSPDMISYSLCIEAVSSVLNVLHALFHVTTRSSPVCTYHSGGIAQVRTECHGQGHFLMNL